jgi:hypothetical protein
VLEKCGFARVAETSEFDERIGQTVEMYLYELK